MSGYSNPNENHNDQAQLQILDEVNLQVVEQEQAIRQLEVSINNIVYYLGTSSYFKIITYNLEWHKWRESNF